MTEVLAKTTAHSERRGNHTPQPEGRIGVRLHKGAFRGLGGSPGETFHGQTLSLQNLELQWVNPSEVQCWTPPAPEGIAGDIAPPPPFHPRQPHPPSFRPCGREGRFPPAAGALQRPRGSRASLGPFGGRGGGDGAGVSPQPGLSRTRGPAGRSAGGSKQGGSGTPPQNLALPRSYHGDSCPQKPRTHHPPAPPSTLHKGRTRGEAGTSRPHLGHWGERGAALRGQRPLGCSVGGGAAGCPWRRSHRARAALRAGAERGRGAPTGAPSPRRRRCPARPGRLTPGCGCHLPAERGEAPPAAPGLPPAPPAASGAAEMRRERLLSLAAKGPDPTHPRTGTERDICGTDIPFPFQHEKLLPRVSSARSWGYWGISVSLGAFLSVHRQRLSHWQSLAEKGIEGTDRAAMNQQWGQEGGSECT